MSVLSVLAIDPGPIKSAIIHVDRLPDGYMRIRQDFGKFENDKVLEMIWNEDNPKTEVIIEMIQGYGMKVGTEVFETCVWIGRFWQTAIPNAMPVIRIGRKDIKEHICDNHRAADTDVRAALIARFGPPGTKKNPGMLYGIKADIWAALAVAVTHLDRKAKCQTK
jgi:hypothetical protein